MYAIRRAANFFFLLLICSLPLYSQQSYSKTLLWRISGHGLRQPSYLFGTMHLNDQRLFTFGDSVYHAIEQSDGLAIEVNPDEMGAYYVNKLFDQVENRKMLQDILKDNDFKKYSAGLAKKFRKPASEVSASDIVKEKNKWMSDYMEKGEMPTFVDAYLYNIARRQGKWLGGIEDMADQAGLLENMVDKSDIDYLLAGDSASHETAANQGVNRMIELYTNQDIEGIEALTNGFSTPDQKDRMLINRNVKMARRIDSLTSLRTMFLAIGAAHLPGDSGVIYLLRKRGFTVEPVISSRKIASKDYTFKEVHLPWYQVDDGQNLYHSFMPGNPATVKLFGLVEMKFLLDIFNMSGFCTMAMVNPSESVNKDSVYDALAMRMFYLEKAPAAKIISSNGVEGREFTHIKKGANIRLQAFLYKNVVYLSYMYAMKAEQLSSADANKFFESFSINKTVSFSSKATVFTDSVMGIRFTAPAAVAYNKKMSNEADNGWKITAFSGSDLANSAYIMLFSKEVKPAHFVPADSLIFNDFRDNIGKQYTAIKEDDQPFQGTAAVKISGRNILQPSIYMNALSILQNGRNIVLMVICDSVHLHAPAIEQVFASLQLIPHPAVAWQNYTTPGGQFSSMAPAPFRIYSPTGRGNDQFYAYDTTTSVSYSIIPDTLSKYFWAKDDSSYWKARAKDNLGDDSLLLQTTVKNGDVPGIELLAMENTKSGRYKRMRLLQADDKLYKLFVSAERPLLYSARTDSFFTSFRVNEPYVNTHFITLPKTEKLLADLLSRDSATRNGAITWLYKVPLAEKDRGALQQALFKPYLSLYDTAVDTRINYEIVDRLAELDTAASIAFAQQVYGNLTERKDTIKNIALTLLAKLHTKESYAAIEQLLAQAPPRQSFAYQFTNALRDSLPLTATIYPGLQKLAPDTLFTEAVAGIANELLDSNLVKLDKIKPAEPGFLQAAKALLPGLCTDSMGYLGNDLVDLLGHFNDPAAHHMLQQYLSVYRHWLKKRVALQLIKNNQPVAPAVLNGLAADKSIRSSLYSDLKEQKKQGLFPAKYLTQAYFAEAAMYDATSEEDEDDFSDMQFVSKQTGRYKNKNYVFYCYKVTVTGEDGPAYYLGIAGGYTSGTALQPAAAISGVYRGKDFDAKKLHSLLADYIESIGKYDEEKVVE